MYVCLECVISLRPSPLLASRLPPVPPPSSLTHLPSVLVDTGISGKLQNDVSVAPDCWNLVIISSLFSCCVWFVSLHLPSSVAYVTELLHLLDMAYLDLSYDKPKSRTIP